jgi:hypothetical protein
VRGALLLRSSRLLAVVMGLMLFACATAVIAGCGGESTTVTVTSEETSEDSSGETDELQDELEEELQEEEEGATSGSGDCDEKEVSSGAYKEGTCTEEGHKIVVVNRETPLKLKTLEAELEDIQLKKTITSEGESETANGVYVIFDLKITNLGHAPAEFEESQATLLISENLYTPDFEVQNGYETRSFLWQGEQIQPLNSQRGTITFDIPKKLAADLTENGNLDIINFGTNSFGGEENYGQDEIGTIRTYK